MKEPGELHEMKDVDYRPVEIQVQKNEKVT